ncbi:MAG: glycoside hydrolase family 9 protein [Balneolaceae bacterium]|nr:glycoside hydrolase family 9 protein [Balneolaceae bacterium]
MKYLISLFALVLCFQTADAQRLTDAIKLNQIGFYPESQKIAVVPDSVSGSFYVVSPDFSDTLLTGILSDISEAPNSEEQVRTADFSEVNQAGHYVLWIPGLGHSYPFSISDDVYEEAAKAALKGFYFQRASTAIPYEYGGKWARPAGHSDNEVIIHPSAASDQRPAGSTISAPKGWYDAGDYNKYAVNSGISTATLLSLYEDFPEYMNSFEIDIPESENGLPDILDEALWNLRWYMKMQDPSDGGVYHKLTSPNFSGQVMPVEDTDDRYVVQKSVTGTLNFAAVMAQAARVFRGYQNEAPAFADSAVIASLNAWLWARQNQDAFYNQGELNEEFDPDITTGAYGDGDATDEFIWAATELFATTKNSLFYNAIDLFPSDQVTVPSWANVRSLAYYTMARLSEDLSESAPEDITKAEQMIVAMADSLINSGNETGYGTIMDRSADNYIWGSSSVAANQGIALIQAYLITENDKYIDYALSNLDYLFGRNATGYSFLTGYGSKTPMNIHHRPSGAHIIPEPVPGLLAGGPNAGQQDGCEYPSDLPALSYVDDYCSYASNEIAINWNAPMVYLSAALEALQDQTPLSQEN